MAFEFVTNLNPVGGSAEVQGVFVADDGYLYMATAATGPLSYRLYRIFKTTMTVSTFIQLDDLANNFYLSFPPKMIQVGDKLYLHGDNDLGTCILQIDLGTFDILDIVVNQIESGGEYNDIGSAAIATDGSFIYAATGNIDFTSGNSHIYKIDITDFANIDATLDYYCGDPGGVSFFSGLEVSNGYLYVLAQNLDGVGDGSHIAIVRLSDFTKFGTPVSGFTGSGNGGATLIMNAAESFLYTCTFGAGTGIKMDRFDITTPGTPTWSGTSTSFQSSAGDTRSAFQIFGIGLLSGPTEDGYLYAGTTVLAGGGVDIRKFDIADIGVEATINDYGGVAPTEVDPPIDLTTDAGGTGTTGYNNDGLVVMSMDINHGYIGYNGNEATNKGAVKFLTAVGGGGATVSSITGPIGNVNTGNTLTVTVVFSDTVDVTGNPVIDLVLDSGTVQAEYTSGTGTDTLVFTYTVESDDFGTVVDVVNPIDLNGGTIDTGPDPADLVFSDYTASSSVNSVYITEISGPTGNTTTGGTLTVEVVFSDIVTVNAGGGTPTIDLVLDSGTVQAEYASGAWTNTLVFEYVVQGGDFSADPIQVNDPVDLNGGLIQDADLQNVALYFTDYTTDATVNATTIDVIAGPTGDFITTETLLVEVIYTDVVTVNTGGGTPTIELTLDSGTVEAAYTTGSGTTMLSFEYVVQAGDYSNEAFVNSPIVLNGGTIEDGATNPVDLTFDEYTSDATVNVPAITTVNAFTTNLEIGDTLTITVVYNGTVIVTGTPSISVPLSAVGSSGQAGDVSVQYVSGSGTDTLTFEYIVQNGDFVGTDAVLNGPINLNGGTIQNGASRDADLTFSPFFISGSVGNAIQSITTNQLPASIYTGQKIDIFVEFTVPIEVVPGVDGSLPSIAISMNSGNATANFISRSDSDTLVFRYIVQASDFNNDGTINILDPIALNGSNILGLVNDDPGQLNFVFFEVEININSDGQASTCRPAGYVFQIDLETKDISLPLLATVTGRGTYFPDIIKENRELKHGDRFILYGLESIYVRDTYTGKPDSFIKIVGVCP